MEFATTDETTTILDELVENGRLHPEKAEFAREKYNEIFIEATRTLAAQTNLSSAEANLQRQLNSAMLEAEGNGDEVIEKLQREMEEAQTQAILVVQKEESLKEEIQELEEMKIDTEIRVKSDTERHRKELQSIIENLEEELKDLQESISKAEENTNKSEREVLDISASLEECEEEIRNLQKEKENECRQLKKIKSEPTKRKNQNEMVQSVLNGTKVQSSEAEAQFHEKETTLATLVAQQREADMELTQAQSTSEQGRVALEGKAADINDIQHDMDLILTEYQQHLADRVQIDLLVKEKDSEVKKTQEDKKRAEKEKEDCLQVVREAEQDLKSFKEQLPILDIALQKLQKEREELENQITLAQKEALILKKDEDIVMNEILKDEKNYSGMQDVLQHTINQNKSLEQELETHKSVARANRQMFSSLMSHRDRLLRTLSSITKRQKESEEDIELKQKDVNSLELLLQEKQKRLMEFQELYDLMKNERNQFLHLTKMSRQGEQELESKTKLLENEAECQRSELEERKKKLQDVSTEHEITKSERDAARNEVETLRLELSRKVATVEEENAKIEKTLTTINQCEMEMQKEKTKFEALLQNRNYTGLLLIDRNDELCLLYEKYNLHEHISRHGELELQRREDEVRMLKIKSRDAERSIDALRKRQEEISGFDHEIALLQCQLLEARRQTREKSESLEDAETGNRWRRLPGMDPEIEQLEAKIRELEQTIENKEVELKERALVLGEISRVTQKMKAKCTGEKMSANQLGEDLLKQQQKIQVAKLKVKATKAELSILKDVASESAVEFTSLQCLLEKAKRRLEEGLPPTEDVEKEWEQFARHEETIRRLALEKTEISKLMSDNSPQSTCEPRPNAYIPEDLGIPRPYGAGVFKPTAAGANLRHYRKPNIPDIII